MSTRNYSSTAAQTTLASGVDASNTTLSVSATTGFPSVPFILAVDAGAAAQELVLVTNVAGLNLTVTRGYDSTVPVAHDAGAVVSHSHGAIDFREANTHVNATSGVHGASGAIMGAADVTAALTARSTAAETLTNKNLSSTTNSFPSSSAGVTNGTNVNAGSTTAYRRTGVVVVEVSAQATATLAAGATLFTLAAEYRPPATCWGETVNSSTGAVVRLDIATNGAVTIATGVDAGQTLRGHFVLPL